MTPPLWNRNNGTAPRTGALAPLTGASGAVMGVKTKTKTNNTKKEGIPFPKRIRLIADSWQNLPTFLTGLRILVVLAVQDWRSKWNTS